MKRRTVLGGLGSVGLATLSGCLGAIGMDEHESSPAGVEASVRSETGYDQTGVEPVVIEETVSAGPVSETITVTNYLTEHEKAVDMGLLGRQRGAVFMVLTTPQIGVAGRNFNPVEEMDAQELVELVENNYDAIGSITPEEDDEITILEQSTTRSRFSAEATFNGQDLDVDLHVSEAIEAGDDLLVTIGVYPQRVRSMEESNILDLMRNVSTDVETDADSSADGDGDGDDTDGSDETDDGNDTDGSSDADSGDDGLLGTLS
ncbi:DUF6517 family protein [Natronorubrum aibiense]|uniref:Uncharacterized protein n=1 Tax=Natronorubrum aibiense TaxID=348826 RepID=A0A5P9P529_9EURY|nr:DUF6517 family protein [Natronorubrum aibiense]QFU83254.1 hypothetical protein GCU68_12275 [Natronorubrum aibiense]